MLSDLRLYHHQGVLVVELARPTKKNALTSAMYADLTQILIQEATRADVQVLVLCGEGGDFCAGNDLHDFLDAPEDQRGAAAIAFLRALCTCPLPLVIAVEGFAIGIGTTMLLHADIVIASETARFRLPFVDLGLCPEGASSLLLSQRAGYLQASEWLLLGDEFSGPNALQAGVVTRLVAPGQARSEAMAVAARLAQKPKAAVAATRQLLRQATRGDVQATLEREFVEFTARLKSPETREKIAAVMQRHASARAKPGV